MIGNLERHATRKWGFEIASDSTRQEAWACLREFAGKPEAALYVELAGPIVPEWAANLTRATAPPAGDTTLEERKQALMQFKAMPALQYHGNKVKAMEIYRHELERGNEDAFQQISQFVGALGAAGAEHALKDYLPLKLSEPGPRALYLEALQLGYTAEWPGQWTRLLPSPPGSLEERLQLWRELRPMKCIQLHQRKIEVFELIARMVDKGQSFTQARDEVMSFLKRLEGAGCRVEADADSPLRNYHALGLQRPENREVYSWIAGVRYTGEWPARILTELQQPCRELDLKGRWRAFQELPANRFTQLHANRLAVYRLFRTHPEAPRVAELFGEGKLPQGRTLLALEALAQGPLDLETYSARIRGGEDAAEAAVAQRLPEPARPAYDRMLQSLPAEADLLRWDAAQTYEKLVEQGRDPEETANVLVALAPGWHPAAPFAEAAEPAPEPAHAIAEQDQWVQVGPVRVRKRR